LASRIVVTVEATPKRAFATAVEWPGWSRSGKTAHLALESLAAYAPRYARFAERAGERLPPQVSVDDLDVVERLDGSAGTEFGVPSRPSDHDARPLTAAEAKRRASIVEAAWQFFDETAAAAPEALRKGPRGGGRTTSRIVDHILDADRAYAHEIGVRIATVQPDDPAGVPALRDAMLAVLRDARDGTPLAGRRWPARYAAHRIAWHGLDHAWEIEDRTE
jgi:hypothetical protein